MGYIAIIVVVVIAVVLVFLAKYTRRVFQMIPIDDPVVRILYFQNDTEGKELAQGDLKIYNACYENLDVVGLQSWEQFDELISSERVDLLHVEFSVNEEGQINDGNGQLRRWHKVVQEASNCQASFVLFGQSNPGLNYKIDDELGGHKMNIVLTIDRKDSAFFNFFRQLVHQHAGGARWDKAWKKVEASSAASVQPMPETLTELEAPEIILLPTKFEE